VISYDDLYVIVLNVRRFMYLKLSNHLNCVFFGLGFYNLFIKSFI